MNTDKGDELLLRLAREGKMEIVEKGERFAKPLTVERAQQLNEQEKQKRKELEPALEAIRLLRERLKEP